MYNTPDKLRRLCRDPGRPQLPSDPTVVVAAAAAFAQVRTAGQLLWLQLWRQLMEDTHTNVVVGHIVVVLTQASP